MKMTKNKKNRRAGYTCLCLLFCAWVLTVSGCVDQHPKDADTDDTVYVDDSEVYDEDWYDTEVSGDENRYDTERIEESSGTDDTESLTDHTVLEITDKQELANVRAAAEKIKQLDHEPRIIATSPATADICDRLDIDLVGVCSSSVSSIPARYENVTQVGTAMSPDMEIVSSLDPDWILSPASLQNDLEPKYEAIGTDWAFLNLKSVQGMYRSIQELGILFDREDKADALVMDFLKFYDEYQQKNKSKTHPKVLILMGLPGSYIIATPNSYVGNLVELAGGENVYADSTEEFLTVNTEDMKTKEPDVILRAAHALPDQVIEMFDEDFKTNDIWQHFEAVKAGRVYDLSYDKFGMSATFAYPEALEELEPLLYSEEGETEHGK